MRLCFYTAALAASLFVTSCHALPDARLKSPRLKGRAPFHDTREENTVRQRDSNDTSRTYIPITSPYQNIFRPLTDVETADVTNWDNTIVTVETLAPNKSAALPYLNANTTAPPKRYARATLKFAATHEPYFEDYLVGPLPVGDATECKPLTFIYNKGVSTQRLYDADGDKVGDLIEDLGADVAPILLDLYNATDGGDEGNGSLSAWRIDPLSTENGDVIAWYQYWRNPTLNFDDSTLLPQGLYFKLNITGRDPNGWGVMGWYYDGIFYGSTEDFREAWKAGKVSRIAYETDGTWGTTDWNREELPLDQYNPPMAIKPDNPRFGLDVGQKYVEWMDFSFFIAFTRDTGLALYDIRYKGERIIYELSMQEALAHYASSDPYQAGIAYLDSFYGFGPFAFELVNGYDCPSYSAYLNTSFYASEKTHWHPNSICMFEFENDYPIQRHSTARYVSITKNIKFVVRTVCSVGNYDYQFTYEFHLDGSIQVLVRASGYIQSAFWAHNADYGFKIHDALSGSMHDHVLSFKLDLDVKGTANSLMKTEFVPVTETYPWSNDTRNTMKLSKTFITNEADAKIHWSPNSAAVYSVVNKDTPNPYGEYPGWKIVPTTGTTIHLTNPNSSTLPPRSHSWSAHPLSAVLHHDTEPRCASPLNALDPAAPLVDFSRFAADNESLDGSDVVLYFTLGMHHAPDTADLPNTVATLAQSGVTIAPQNYLVGGDASRASRWGVRVDAGKGGGRPAEVVRFGGGGDGGDGGGGGEEAGGMFNLTAARSGVEGYQGGFVVRKFPYDPANWWWEGEAEDQQSE
ncbi:copper amine oxidase [Diplodia corticola]|uniref:Amine oxidase n=1 Tax=Diplodia corticola TaxID=236234 RepID=A0A1J9QJG8_9PEZI|nr:copper amine oxidase [Diplodia corticola]OJD28624.1 copper amine oxidase [Diplodia corticola]